ncbi:Threonine/homoserine/homoserine lactone efflux protein [Poseidonocella pacifica]|uniref:Threonine/homoserine/homoserine lactone efflux protein n=1 Tax=Poseidonocella pacifica TaxID=871651 RepID=A0A1I0VGB6_9RHOB|nr:LysE family transporter [Poseidonocella pacifica]SFA74636.1 Threonine/homoserine/homoserine lactone efflux protein [Poseidonocella pacifica]
MTATAFWTVAYIHLVAAMSPGPSFVVSVRTAVSEGFPTAAALALGYGIGAVLWASVAMAGLALLFELVPGLFFALKLGGGAFLLFLGVTLWRQADAPLPDASDQTPKGPSAAIWLGFATFVANPKTAVFFGAIFIGLVPESAPLPVLAALVTVIFLNETLWYIAVARLFSLPRARAVFIRAKPWLDRVFGTLLAAFGLKIALT